MKRHRSWLHLGVTSVLLLGGLPVAAAAQQMPEKPKEAAPPSAPDEMAPPSAPPHPSPAALAFSVRQGEGSFLGVRIRDVTDSTVSRLKLPEERGALVTDVTEDSPASKAGIQENDVILRWNQEPVESVAELERLVSETPPGRSVKITVFRDGRQRTVTAQLAERPAPSFYSFHMGPEQQAHMREQMERARDELERVRGDTDQMRQNLKREIRLYSVFPGMGPHRLGVRLQPLTEQLGAYFGAKDGQGALVASVDDSSAASAAGIRAGDVIVSIGGEEVQDPADAARIVGSHDAGSVKIELLRKGEHKTVEAKLPERSSWMEAPHGDMEGMLRGVEPSTLAPLVRSIDLRALEPALERVREIRIPDMEQLRDLRIPSAELQRLEVPDVEIRVRDLPDGTETIEGMPQATPVGSTRII